MALGGKANSTGRGNGLKSFIREGQRSTCFLLCTTLATNIELFYLVPPKLQFTSKTKERRRSSQRNTAKRSWSPANSPRKGLRPGRSRVRTVVLLAPKKTNCQQSVIIWTYKLIIQWMFWLKVRQFSFIFALYSDSFELDAARQFLSASSPGDKYKVCYLKFRVLWMETWTLVFS